MNSPTLMKSLSLVVPSLTQGGGVPSVARFLNRVAIQSGRYQVRLISLSADSRDPSSLLFSRPSTWLKGVSTNEGVWEGASFTHVGAFGGELEFQRYKPRRPLTELLDGSDLIQVIAGSPSWINPVLGLGIPTSLQVATRAKVERRLRDSKLSSAADYWRRWMTEFTDKSDDAGIRGADAIQVENNWMLNYCKKVGGGTSQDIRYAPPGVNCKTFHPSLQNRFKQEPYILCVARLSDPRKNVELLLRAYSLLAASTRKMVKLVLAGSSSPAASFWAHAEKLGISERISYVEKPSTEELVSLYQNARVFALPSDEEGLGIVVLEAMACGVPVISTRSGGPDGIITHGDDGFLTALNDEFEMAAHLERLLLENDLNLAMGESARRTMLARFDEEVTARTFLDVWEKLLNREVSNVWNHCLHGPRSS